MQPRRRGMRPFGQELRPQPPLVYERLSDPILITRTRAGDGRALETLEEDGRAAAGPGPGPGPARAAELRTLPENQARVVVLKDALEYSFDEISAASGMPVATAKCYDHRGRAGLRERLEHDAA